jgi:hypothetical protein
MSARHEPSRLSPDPPRNGDQSTPCLRHEKVRGSSPLSSTTVNVALTRSFLDGLVSHSVQPGVGGSSEFHEAVEAPVSAALSAVDLASKAIIRSASFRSELGQLALITVTFVPPPLMRMAVDVLLLASLVSKNQFLGSAITRTL